MTQPEQHHPLVKLAVATIDAYVREGRMLMPAEAPELTASERAGVFVTIHTRAGDLRGCIGTIEPVEDSVIEETIHNAVSAATRDPRFPPIEPCELDNLVVDVSVLYPPERINSTAELDPRIYGVIVQRGRHRGLLLPDIPGIDDAETQVAFARQKAWISPNEPIEMFRFRVDKYR